MGSLVESPGSTASRKDSDVICIWGLLSMAARNVVSSFLVVAGKRADNGGHHDLLHAQSVSCSGRGLEPGKRVQGRGALSEFHIKRFRVAPARAICGRGREFLGGHGRPPHQPQRSISGDHFANFSIQDIQSRQNWVGKLSYQMFLELSVRVLRQTTKDKGQELYEDGCCFALSYHLS